MNISSSPVAADLTVLSQDGERVLCRGWRDGDNGDRTAVLAVPAAPEHCTPNFVNRLVHEYELKDELDGRSVRPLALVREHGRIMLLLEDPGGEPLDRLHEFCFGHYRPREWISRSSTSRENLASGLADRNLRQQCILEDRVGE